MREPVRMGLIGCGGISRAHVRGFQNLGPEEVRVVITCDEKEELAAQRAQEAGAEAWTTRWEEVLERPDVEAVDLCLPHHLHAPAAIAAAQAGKHILVEKPLATTLEAGKAMIDAAQGEGVVLMVAFCQRYDPQHQAAKRFVEEGWLGRPVLAHIDHHQDVNFPAGHWARSRSRLGGGAIAGSGCHRLDLLRWFLGEVEEVWACTFSWPERLEGEVAGVVGLRFANGAVGNLSINWMSRHRPWYERFWLEGTEGCIHNHQGLQAFSLLRPEWAQGFVALEVPSADPFTEEIRHFLTCVREGKEPLTNGPEALRTLAVVLAAYEAERTGGTVRPADLLGSL